MAANMNLIVLGELVSSPTYVSRPTIACLVSLSKALVIDSNRGVRECSYRMIEESSPSQPIPLLPLPPLYRSSSYPSPIPHLTPPSTVPYTSNLKRYLTHRTLRQLSQAKFIDLAYRCHSGTYVTKTTD